MDDKFEHAYEDIKKDANKQLDTFREMVAKEKDKVLQFDISNLDELLKMILMDCEDLTDIEIYTEILDRRNDNNNELKEKLLYQKNLTKRDIIEENIFKIYTIYNIILATVWITSSDMLAFIRSFLTCMVIFSSTFIANLRYFTSDTRKQQIDNTVEALDRMTKINQYEIGVFNQFRAMYIDELKCEVRKLYEITQHKDYSYEDVSKMLEDIKMGFLIDNSNGKRRIRKK